MHGYRVAMFYLGLHDRSFATVVADNVRGVVIYI